MDEDKSQNTIQGPGNSTYFDLARKGLKNFPIHLYNECAYIQCLYLEGNVIEELEEAFFPSLQCLEWLDIRNNRLYTLPKTIAHHPNLQVLLLQDNKITKLPLELGLVPKLQGMQVSGNPLEFPPLHVVEKGVEGILQFLREERNLQAPSHRPIAEPFYKVSSPPASKYKPKSIKPHKKRTAPSSLPAISVTSYHNFQQQQTPTRPTSQYKLVDSTPVCDMSNKIQSVSSSILQMWPNSQDRSEVKIQDNLLKEMFVLRIRNMLNKQQSIIQRCKDREVLSNWRKSGTRRVQHNKQLTDWPYDIDPLYMTMLSRAEIQPSAQERRKTPTDKREVNEEISEIFKAMQLLGKSTQNIVLSSRSQQTELNDEIQTLVRLQKKLQKLHLQNVSVPSLPIRGHSIKK